MSKVYVNLQISGEVDASALAAFMSSIGNPAINTSPSSQGEEPKPRTRTAPKTEDQPETQAQPDVKGKTAAGDEVGEVPSVEDVTKAGLAYAKANGRDAFIELLAGYGAKNVSGVPEDKRAELLEKLGA